MMEGLILAIQFFTRIPINREIPFDNKNIGRSLFFLPFIGLFIGVVASIPFLLIHDASKAMASILSVILIIGFTGGLHLDGLADTFDGFLSGRIQARIMEIMKDSTLGAFGAIALILLIISKFIAIYELRVEFWLAIPLSLGNARLVAGYIILTKKNARGDGLGALFKGAAAGKNLILAGVLYTGIVLYFSPWYLLPLVGSWIMGETMSWWSYKKINGLTGDVYGAIIELGEVASMIIFWGVILWI
ncbi:MAG: adenosylcobinamide-GDP ribazoletransferase [Bacillota bacterium]